MMLQPYTPSRPSAVREASVRGAAAVRLQWHVWGEDVPVTPERPLLLMCHGWMDVGASFQFVVDRLRAPRRIVAPDWRGFGGSAAAPTDSYAFTDYLGDLDALLDVLQPDGAPVDLLGHSMGGNVVMSYAGVRPQRIRRLVNLEGFGLPATRPAQAPTRLVKWLDELRQPAQLRPHASLEAVADRLRKTNPRLPPDKALWLASQWSQQRDDGLWHLRADPAHKHSNPVLYRVDEILEIWRRIAAPLLFVEGAQTDLTAWWGSAYSLAEFHERLKVVPNVTKERIEGAGHMLHHDQPERLAALLEHFLS